MARPAAPDSGASSLIVIRPAASRTPLSSAISPVSDISAPVPETETSPSVNCVKRSSRVSERVIRGDSPSSPLNSADGVSRWSNCTSPFIETRMSPVSSGPSGRSSARRVARVAAKPSTAGSSIKPSSWTTGWVSGPLNPIFTAAEEVASGAASVANRL